MAGDISGRRSRLEVEERKAGWGADERGRLVRGAKATRGGRLQALACGPGERRGVAGDAGNALTCGPWRSYGASAGRLGENGSASAIGWLERRCWAGGAAGPAQKVGPRGGRWVWAGKLGLGLLWVFPFLFLFLFYFSLKLNYLNSKEILNSNPYEIKQLKQCISMNASTKLNLRKFLITCETKTRLNAILTQ